MSRHLSKQEFIEKLQDVSLMAVDLNLFLDTHPTCEKALADYKKVTKLYQDLKAEYEKEYGPLSNYGTFNQTEIYNWTQDPWPWQRQTKED